MEDKLQWKMNFNGRQPSMEDNLQKEDNLQWKRTFNGRQPSIKSLSICIYLVVIKHLYSELEFDFALFNLSLSNL